MLLPNFTIRTLLMLTLGCGAFFAFVAAAARGAAWAQGLVTPVFIVARALLLQMLTYVLAYLLSSLTSSAPRKAGGSPFAETQPSDQIVPPQEEEW